MTNYSEQDKKDIRLIIEHDIKSWLDVTGCLSSDSTYYHECLGAGESCAEKLVRSGYGDIENAIKKFASAIKEECPTNGNVWALVDKVLNRYLELELNPGICYRGFHSNEKGETTICMEGLTFKGEWYYWDEFSRLVDEKGKHILDFKGDPCLVEPGSILGETIGKWATTDIDGNNVFEGDIVTCFEDTLTREEDWTGEMTYYSKTLQWIVTQPNSGGLDFDYYNKKWIQLKGNKWEFPYNKTFGDAHD